METNHEIMGENTFGLIKKCDGCIISKVYRLHKLPMSVVTFVTNSIWCPVLITLLKAFLIGLIIGRTFRVISDKIVECIHSEIQAHPLV